MSEAPIYLDWNATTPPLPEVVSVVSHEFENTWGNPASVHATGRRARARVEDAREAIASVLNVDSRDVLFTSGGTEANNLALRGAVGLATSRLEHPSVVRVAETLSDAGVPVEWLPVSPSGQVDPEAVRPALERLPSGSILAVAAVNHETGIVQPLQELRHQAASSDAYLHIDAVQALGKVEPREFDFGDSVAIAAHKIRGPKGIGALVWRGKPPRPVLVGGAQERGLRPGTQDAALAAGFRVAVEHARTTPPEYRQLAPLRDRLEGALLQQGVRNGDPALRLPHVCNVSVQDWSGDELVAALDLLGISVSSGSACSAGTAEPSPVIAAMVGVERARSAVRVSLGETTTEADVERVLAAFHRVLDTAHHG